MQVGTQIGPYKIISLLGHGGMGEVYRARDVRLNRDVAVKVLPKEFASDAWRLRRFEKETKALAALNHPNVLTIHDVGVHEGEPYLVSELLRGRTLREELGGEDSAALPLRKAVEYGMQIAQGLAAAHAKGAVHRDLKPENIYVTPDGRVKILDFGLAKLRENRQPDSPQRGLPQGSTIVIEADDVINTTAPGMVMGTPGYMSPEQVRGDPVDQRTDIFAFGCVFYEMLTGLRAFPGNTPVESMNATLKEAPAELGTINPKLPLSLGRVVERCLEKEPDNRFQTANDLAFALEQAGSREVGIPAQRVPQPASWKRPTASVVAALIVAGCIWVLTESGWRSKSSENSSRGPSASLASSIKSVAVLPFVNMSADNENEYLSDGITEELLNSLTKVKGLRVPGRGSCFAFKGKTGQEVLKEMGEKLRVNAVVEGSVRKAGNQLRIAAQLISVGDGFEMWSEEYDRDVTNIFVVQSDIAGRVASALQVQLGVEQTSALAKKPTENPEAYRLYLLGRYHFAKVTQMGWSNSLRYFNQALERVLKMGHFNHK